MNVLMNVKHTMQEILSEKKFKEIHVHEELLHHDHMICTKCNRITEFTDEHLEKLQLQIADIYGFQMLRHKMEIYGICKDCLKDQASLIPLSMAKEGNKLIIKEYVGGNRASMRLINMGLRIGDKIEVIRNSGQGQMVIALDYSRFVLGRGIACKIMVEQDSLQ